VATFIHIHPRRGKQKFLKFIHISYHPVPSAQ
jgi:hypothetical protein